MGREAVTDGLTIELLGPPVITVAGRPLEVDTRKAVAVVALVAMDGPTSRASLAARLWPDSDEGRARGALRRTLSVLNGALGSRWLTAGPSVIALGGERCEVDTDRLAAALDEIQAHGHPAASVCPDCSAPLRDAAALHRGEFLEGFALRDGAEFDAWRTGHAERLRRELCTVLDRLVRVDVEAGDLDGALAAAERWLAIDPLSEPVHARLMLLHGWRGERAAAIRRYRDCSAVLDRELGVRPLARTTALYQAIVEGRLDAPAPTPGRASSHVTPAERPSDGPALPFVGRDAELTAAVGHLGATGGRVLVVHGEAGIGKSRFVEELIARIDDAEPLGARCRPGERGLALAPVIELLRAAATRPGAADRLTGLPTGVRGEAGRLLPATVDDGDPPPAPLDSPGAHARFLDAILTSLLTAAEPHGTRPVVVIEDLHAADDATADLLAFLARRLAEYPVALVLTWRSDLTSPAGGLHRVVTEPDVADRALVIELGRLGERAVDRLHAAVTGSAAPPELRDRLRDEAGGLPLALVEYLRWLREHGTDPTGQWPIPPGVRDLVERRLDGLSETATQVGTAAAVLGHGLELAVLGRIAGRSEEETVAGVDELLARGILRVGHSGPFDFSHEKVRAIAYERCSPARRRLLHARAAAMLRDRAGRRSRGQLAAVIAEHARLGGDDEAAAVWSVRAGDHAAAVFANPEARAHYERALAYDHPDPATVHRRLGRLRLLDGDYGAALEGYETAAAHATDPRVLAEVEHELGALHLRRGEWSAARAHLESALRRLPSEATGAAARVATDLGLTELQSGSVDAARRQATAALALAEQAHDRRALAQARNLSGLLARRRGDVAGAQRHLEQAAAVAATLADPTAYIAVLNNLALITADAGDSPRAVALLTTAIERCERQGDRHRAAALHGNLADLHRRRGEEAAAAAHAEAAPSPAAGEPAAHDPEIFKLVGW